MYIYTCVSMRSLVEWHCIKVINRSFKIITVFIRNAGKSLELRYKRYFMPMGGSFV